MYISIVRGVGAGFRDVFFPAIMACETSHYDRTNYTIANQRDMILENSIIHPCIRVKIPVVPSSLP
ncbi:hypothetical protein [Microcoleus sp. Pol17_C1]|uniref:hypothetical protein n=1 Tax=unclassified Microcoleus TaxID=2642155 RepID=UPI002FCF1903